MRWHPKPIPKYGDLKSSIKFAFWPTKVNGLYVWLESYRVNKTWTKGGVPFVGMTGVFHFDGWVTKNELID